MPRPVFCACRSGDCIRAFALDCALRAPSRLRPRHLLLGDLEFAYHLLAHGELLRLAGRGDREVGHEADVPRDLEVRDLVGTDRVDLLGARLPRIGEEYPMRRFIILAVSALLMLPLVSDQADARRGVAAALAVVVFAEVAVFSGSVAAASARLPLAAVAFALLESAVDVGLAPVSVDRDGGAAGGPGLGGRRVGLPGWGGGWAGRPGLRGAGWAGYRPGWGYRRWDRGWPVAAGIGFVAANPALRPVR